MGRCRWEECRQRNQFDWNVWYQKVSVTKGNIWGFQFQMYFLLVAEFKSQWSASLPSNHNYGDYGEIFLSELISSKYCKISQLSQIGSEVVRLGEWLSQGNFLFGGIKLPNLPRLSISRNMIFTGIRFDYQISVNKKIDWAPSQKYWSVRCFSSSVY